MAILLEKTSSPYSYMILANVFSSTLFMNSSAVGPSSDILMSNGPSDLNENPLSFVSICGLETPRSKTIPLTLFILVSFKYFSNSENFPFIKVNLFSKVDLIGAANSFACGSLSIAKRLQLHLFRISLEYPPKPNVAST